MREAAWMPARKSGRRLMVLMIPATVPLGLTDLACAYTSASGRFASASSTILIRATTLLTANREKSVGAADRGPWLLALRVALRQVLEGLRDVAQSLPDLAQLMAVVARFGLRPAACDLVD